MHVDADVNDEEDCELIHGEGQSNEEEEELKESKYEQSDVLDCYFML